MAAAGIGGGGDHDLPLEEVDAVLASFSGDPAAVFAPLPSPEAAAAGASASRELVGSGESLREGFGDVEEFLMPDCEDEALLDGVDEFLDGILVEDGEGSPPKPTGEKSAGGACAGEDEVVVCVDCDDDPNSKKKWRQMRNKDSAMKSREKKKLYVKDMEMKSKYLEAECCRLSYALQCCTAENMALRQSLLKDRHAGAHTAMQESAELTETLPLVSLLWLVSILCRFLVDDMPNRSLVAPRSLERDLVKPTKTSINDLKMTRMTINVDSPGALGHIHLGRRCRGIRVRIKSPWVPWHAAQLAKLPVIVRTISEV